MNLVEVVRRGARRSSIYAVVVSAAMLPAVSAMAQFYPREGFTADGTAHWSFEVSPYLFLPNVDATVGLAHPPGHEVSIDQNRPTVSKLATSLTGAFTADSLIRHRDWSAELNVFYISAEATKTIPPLLPRGPGSTLKSTVSGVLVSPGIGYRVFADDASKVAIDARVGLTYNSISATAGFERDVQGGVSHESDFVQPWIGARVDYFPTPKWRLETTGAITGLGVDGGAVGWNANAGVSYLVTNWFDVTLGYAATQTRRYGRTSLNGESRSVSLLAYGPVMAVGFRF